MIQTLFVKRFGLWHGVRNIQLLSIHCNSLLLILEPHCSSDMLRNLSPSHKCTMRCKIQNCRGSRKAPLCRHRLVVALISQVVYQPSQERWPTNRDGRLPCIWNFTMDYPTVTRLFALLPDCSGSSLGAQEKTLTNFLAYHKYSYQWRYH